MKAAAGLKRGSRKKQNNHNGVVVAQEQREEREQRPGRQVEVPTHEVAHHQHHHRRSKPTIEEAALTSKNYRLAKELVRRCFLKNFHPVHLMVSCFWWRSGRTFVFLIKVDGVKRGFCTL